jgi:hypothetical protein
MFSVPIYFQITQNASNTVAGAHLFPAVVGNAFGGLISGYAINRYVTIQNCSAFHLDQYTDS